MSKDFIGNELNVGDKVVITQPNYRNFVIGEIVKMSKKMAEIRYHYQDRDHIVKQFFYQIIKKNVDIDPEI